MRDLVKAATAWRAAREELEELESEYTRLRNAQNAARRRLTAAEEELRGAVGRGRPARVIRLADSPDVVSVTWRGEDGGARVDLVQVEGP